MDTKKIREDYVAHRLPWDSDAVIKVVTDLCNEVDSLRETLDVNVERLTRQSGEVARLREVVGEVTCSKCGVTKPRGTYLHLVKLSSAEVNHFHEFKDVCLDCWNAALTALSPR